MNTPKPFVKREQKGSISSQKRSDVAGGEKTSCIDLQELFQFEAARERALSQLGPSVYENPFSEFVPHRIFINQIDTFNGSHLADYLINVRKSGGEDEIEAEEELNSGNVADADFDLFEKEEEAEENGEMDGEGSERTSGQRVSDVYQIIGSLEFLNNQNYRRPEGIFELLDNEKKNCFLEKLLTCGFIIYDITSDLHCHPKQVEEAKWVLESLVKRLEIYEREKPKEFSKYSHCRVFILISTLMTWVKTKPIDPDDPNLPFTERDFRKRKPHPNYKVHCELEKRVIQLGKKYPKNLKTIVIGTGVTYGYEEDVLHFLFKMAWTCAPFLPIFKPGKDIVPVIHIDSLASIVRIILENFPANFRYIIATDPHPTTMKNIAKLLAKQLGNGKTKTVDKEEAFLFPDIKQRNYDMLTASINIMPGFIMDNADVIWGTELPFEENIPELIKQFKVARELLPVKIFLHGPPASGKTFIAMRLSKYYDIPHLSERGVIEERIAMLKEKIKAKTEPAEEKENKENVEIEGDEANEAGEEEEEDDDDEEEEDVETLKQTLKEIEDNMEKNGGNKLDDEFVLRFFKEKLSSNCCKNKGYVIDGYPATMEQTKILYAPGEDAAEATEEEEQGEDISKLCNVDILPEYVESLDASDEFLINRIIKMPVASLTCVDEDEICHRLTEFRALNTEDNTPLIFYDEMEVHPMIYNMENDPDIHMRQTFNAIVDHVGPPRNYEKANASTENVFEDLARECKNQKMKDLTAQREEAKKAIDERRQNIEKWMFLKNQELEMEEKALSIMGMPLRHYLMKYVFPCLTRGLVEVARLRPDDPVDFLSEFLFRENPEGKMFQPDYEEREAKLAEAMKEYGDMMDGKSREESASTKTFSMEKSVKSDAVSRVTHYKCSFSTKSSKRTVSSSSKSSKSGKSGSGSGSGSGGICTCNQKSPSLSTCSSDRTPSTASSCTCAAPEPCEPCVPCGDEQPKVDPCVCPCDL